MNNYAAYINGLIDLSPFGLEPCPGAEHYFCTPVGAEIFCRPGVDGIHYCTVEGCGGTVFAVSPMNLPGEYVHPVAGSFDDFLRLLMACGDNAAIEQCWQWSREQFLDFLSSQGLPDCAAAAVKELSGQTCLEPMGDPYGYIWNLQEGFDYNRLRFSPDYYE